MAATKVCRGLQAWALPSSSPLPFELRLNEEIPVPELAPEQVLVRVRACGLSSLDVQVFSGNFDVPFAGDHDGSVLGFEVAGIIEAVGSSVQRFSKGDRVAGLLPSDASGGLCELCVISEFFLVKIPPKVTDVDAVSCLLSGVRTYLALQFYIRALAGEVVLVSSATTESSFVCLQLLNLWKLPVLVPVSTTSEQEYLGNLSFKAGTLLDLSRNDIVQAVLSATGGLGVDAVIDLDGAARAPMFSSIDTVLHCLAMGGRWLTVHGSFQLDPPDTNLLRLKSAGLCIVNEQAWLLSTARIGQFLHILNDILSEIDKKRLRPPEARLFRLEQAEEALYEFIEEVPGRKIIFYI